MMNLATMSQTLLLFLVYVCTVNALTDEDLEKILNDAVGSDEIKQLRRFPDSEEIDEFKDRLEAIQSLNSDENPVFGSMNPGTGDDGVRKRPFCNGFTGCGRVHGKRSDSSLLEKLVLSNSDSLRAAGPGPSVSKRPFCNGFFGCGNPGKRIVFRNARFVNHNGFGNLAPRSSSKRFFCNPGAFGCQNPGKRAQYKAWFDSLRSQLRQGPGMP